ncbi:MAG: ABC transporter ATP-binding protein, partial [bacterium]
VRALNTTNEDKNKIEIIAEKIRTKEIKHHFDMAIFDSFKYLNEGFFYVLVICIAIFLASKGIISRGDILVYSILFASITGPLREIHRILDEAHESSIKVNDLFDIMNEPIDRSFRIYSDQALPSNIVFPAIEIVNMSYSYKDDTNILHNINLEISTGERIGIAGVSGCGKSTLIKILLRLIHNYHGDIYLFGQELNDISRESIAQKIAYVPQKPYIFSGTVRENIMYGNGESISDKEIIEASKLANIWDEIEGSLGGLNGKIAEGGNNISGGQKQRLAIARMMLSNPDLIILDEATSALDSSNEAIIQKNIEEKFHNKTIVIIAHRLTTLRNCDRILVFDQGEIAQSGKYYELSRSEGLFKNFLENNKTVTKA